MESLSLSSRLEPYRNKIEESALPSIIIEAKQSEKVYLTESRFGGPSFLPANFEHPLNKFGSKMKLLAQINLAELPPNDLFSRKGLLQFYISPDEVYGRNFRDPGESDFTILFHKDWEFWESPQEWDFSNEEMGEDEFCFPFENKYQLNFKESIGYVRPSDIRFLNYFPQSPFLKDGKLDTKMYEEYQQVIGTPTHALGGYGHFIQEDPRIRFTQYKDFILLLQIDTKGGIMWGDSGAAQFLIHPDDLAKADFTKVVYYWSCF